LKRKSPHRAAVKNRFLRAPFSFREKGAKAFSLIQLLATLVILAIFFALAVPAYQSAMESARRAVCMGNLHQLGVAYRLYAGDHQGLFPPLPDAVYPASFQNNGDYSIPSFFTVLTSGNYVPDNGGTTFFCPSFLYHSGLTATQAFRTYLTGGYVVWAGCPPWDGLYHSVERITDNPQRLLMGDMVTDYPPFNQNHIGRNPSLGAANAMGANWLYVDMHVEWVPQSQLTVTQSLVGITYYLPPTP
jgi:type II secretory pathway pseudopilin PulG